MGLALSQHLVQRMGGRIGFESVPDVGSSFFVELAVATESAEVLPDARGRPGGPRVPPAPTSGGSSGSCSWRTTWPTSTWSSGCWHGGRGVELLAAMHGGLGIELAREHLPDLILVDLHLPDMPGTGVLDRLGEDPATAAIPVAVVGSDAAAHEVRRLLGRGVVGFLTKPFDVRALLSLVDAVRSARVG